MESTISNNLQEASDTLDDSYTSTSDDRVNEMLSYDNEDDFDESPIKIPKLQIGHLLKTRQLKEEICTQKNRCNLKIYALFVEVKGQFQTS